MKKVLFLLVVGLIFIVGCTEQQDNFLDNKPYKVGEYIPAGDFTWRITNSYTTTEIGEEVGDYFIGEKTDGMFIILNVEVENTGKSAKYLSSSYLKIIDQQGREFSSNSAAALYLKSQGEPLIFEEVNPGIIKKGNIVFEVPSELKIAKIRISTGSFSSEFYDVDLNLA